MGDYDLAIYISVFIIMIILLGIQGNLNNNKEACADCPTTKNILDGSAKEIRGIRIGNLKDCIATYPEGYDHEIYSVNGTLYYCSVTFWSSDLQNPEVLNKPRDIE